MCTTRSCWDHVFTFVFVVLKIFIHSPTDRFTHIILHLKKKKAKRGKCIAHFPPQMQWCNIASPLAMDDRYWLWVFRAYFRSLNHRLLYLIFGLRTTIKRTGIYDLRVDDLESLNNRKITELEHVLAEVLDLVLGLRRTLSRPVIGKGVSSYLYELTPAHARSRGSTWYLAVCRSLRLSWVKSGWVRLGLFRSD